MLTSEQLRDFFHRKGVTRVITHANCADGNMSVLLLLRHYLDPTNMVLHFVQYNTPELAAIKDLRDHERCKYLFVDMSPPAEQAEWYQAQDTVVIDHHAGQEELIKSFENHLYSDQPGMAGCTLLASLLCKGFEDLPWYQLAVQVGIRDTWAKGMVNGNDALWSSISDTSEAIKFLKVSKRMSLSELQTKIELLSPILRARKNSRMKSQLKDCISAKVNDLDVVFCAHTDISDAADACKEADLVIGYSFYSNSGMTVSLRSRSRGLNCATFAKAFPGCGGGGHKSAAGLTIPMTRIDNNPIDLLKGMVEQEYVALTGGAAR